MLAKHALYQLSYGPKPSVSEGKMVGLGRLELPTSRLSSARSNQLSYKPELLNPMPTAIAPGRASRNAMTTIADKGSSEEEKETKAAASRMMPLDKRG